MEKSLRFHREGIWIPFVKRNAVHRFWSEFVDLILTIRFAKRITVWVEWSYHIAVHGLQCRNDGFSKEIFDERFDFLVIFQGATRFICLTRFPVLIFFKYFQPARDDSSQRHGLIWRRHSDWWDSCKDRICLYIQSAKKLFLPSLTRTRSSWTY